jgi:hypothetical protein
MVKSTKKRTTGRKRLKKLRKPYKNKYYSNKSINSSGRNFLDPKYKMWRRHIYDRDNHECQWPGCKRKIKLNAHHIRRWADYPTLRFEYTNGITLCEKHHNMIKGNEENYIVLFTSILIGQLKYG